MKKDSHAQAPTLMTVNDAAKHLSISRSSIYRLIRAGELETIHIGRSTRIVRKDLGAYVSSLKSSNRLEREDSNEA